MKLFLSLCATLLVTALTAGLVWAGDLTGVAALTDAAVLMSFLLVNVSLPWVMGRGLAGPRVARRRLDFVLPGLAIVMCGWLLLHTGRSSIVLASLLALVGLLMGRARPNRGANAPSPVRKLGASGDA